MNRRCAEGFGVASVAGALTVLLQVTPVGVAAQAPTVKAATAAAQETAARVPSTAWGEPDLQGIWTYEYQIPLQRPAKYAGKEFFSDEEIAALDRERSGQQSRDFRAAKGSEADVAGAYSAIFMTRKHTGRRTSLIVDPPDGRIPPDTAEARQRMARHEEFRLALLQATVACKNNEPGCAGGKYGPPSPKRSDVPPVYVTGSINRSDNPEDRNPGERCLMGGLPDFGSGYDAYGGSYRRIVQAPGNVSIFHDWNQGQGFHRTIPITMRPHLPSQIRQWWGDSRGHWEGRTLVVDVTNFTAKADYLGARENLHLVERWTRTGPNTLEYGVTLDDPTTWTKPWTVKREFVRQDEKDNRIYYEPRCHEGNYGLPGLLVGARAEDRAFLEGRGPDPATKCNAGCAFGPSGETRDLLQ